MITINSAQGLHILMSHLNYKERIEKYKYPIRLANHPFGLAIPTRPKTADNFRHEPKNFLFFGEPGYTDVSVKNFVKRLAEHYEDNPAVPGEVVFLREIEVQTEPNSTSCAVFFEAGLLQETIMCGGCTSGNGEGGSGRKMLESVFALLGMINGIKVEKIKIPFPQGARLLLNLQETVETFHVMQEN